MALALAAIASGLGGATAVAGPPAADANIVVVEADEAILAPPVPLPFAGQLIRFTPLAQGGYETAVERAAAPTGVAPGVERRRLDFPASGEPLRVSLPRPFPLFGRSHGEIHVHPHGAVSLGEPLSPASRASAASSAELLRDLATGPPVIAALWNELLPGRAADGGGVFVEQGEDRVSVRWVRVPSARPADEPNSFAITLHEDGRVELEYGELATRWGIIGLSPGAVRERTEMVDLATAPQIGPSQAAFAWYHDLPALDEMELAQRVYRELPDRFQFLSVFTSLPVEGPSLVGSQLVKNQDRGIGLRVFDHSLLFGSRNLEHVVLMNDLAFWDDDPTRPPRIPAYAFAPSTLAVLAHEAGHRWIGQTAGTSSGLTSADGHWSFFLESGGSFLGGNRMVDHRDGTFTTLGGLSVFGPLDQYLMGVRRPEEVAPFYVVEPAGGFEPARAASGEAFAADSRPEGGVHFRGTRRDVTIDDLIRSAGERSPRAASGPRVFRMAFVLVVPAGARPSDAQLEKVERIRRGFAPFFQAATDGRARVSTSLPARAVQPGLAEDAALRSGEPRVLGVEVRPRAGGRLAVKLDWVDREADLTTVELSTDAGSAVPPTEVDVVPGSYGARRGSLVVNLRDLPAQAREIRATLLDRRGQRSVVATQSLPGA